MQKVPGRAPAVLAALLATLAMILPGPAGAVTLFPDPSVSVLCLSTAASAGCGGEAAASHYSFSYDLSDKVGTGNIMTGAQLLLDLWDDHEKGEKDKGKGEKDKDTGDGSDKIDIALNGLTIVHKADVQHDLLLPLSDLSILKGGWLEVMLTAHEGDFFFGGSTLTLFVESGAESGEGITGAFVTAADQAVPAPAPLLLLGLGSAVLGWRRWACS